VGIEPVDEFAARAGTVAGFADGELELVCVVGCLFGACGAPLGIRRAWSVAAEILDRVGVVVAEHPQAGAALAGDGLWVLGA
jgi:hypothetical protein